MPNYLFVQQGPEMGGDYIKNFSTKMWSTVNDKKPLLYAPHHVVTQEDFNNIVNSANIFVGADRVVELHFDCWRDIVPTYTPKLDRVVWTPTLFITRQEKNVVTAGVWGAALLWMGVNQPSKEYVIQNTFDFIFVNYFR